MHNYLWQNRAKGAFICVLPPHAHDNKKLTTNAGAPVPDNQNVLTAGPRGPMLLQDFWFLEKLAHFDREVIPERRMHAKGSGVYGVFTVTHDITRYTKAKNKIRETVKGWRMGIRNAH